MPRIIPIGDGAEDYIGDALGLWKRGKRGAAMLDDFDTVLVLLAEKEVKIVVDVYRYALFQQAPGGGLFFDLFEETVPQEFPVFSDPLPPMPTFYPAGPKSLVAPHYDHFDTFKAGDSTALFSVAFASAILSAYGEALSWQGLLVQNNVSSGNSWFLSRYQLLGHLYSYVNPQQSKVSLYNQNDGVLAEVDISAMNVFPAAQLVRPGISYRRLIDADQQRVMLCQQDDGTYSGQISEVVEDSGTLSTVPLALPATPAGSRLDAGFWPSYSGTAGARHVDNVVDIFTSERAQHYYIVKLCSDTAIAYNISSSTTYPDDIQFFPGHSLAVEKRLKTDLSLVATYNLIPTSIDRVNQAVSPTAQSANMVNEQLDGYETGVDIITRFAPFGTGAVLVDEAGNEYPLLMVMACNQDYFWNSTRAYLARGDFLASDLSGSGYSRNVYQQPALLWLGAPPAGFDGWTWGGVDAVGLKISQVQPGLTDPYSGSIGWMRLFGSYIADSDTLLAQLLPWYGTAAGAGLTDDQAGQSNNQRVISVRLVGNTPVVRLEQVQLQTQSLFMFDI